MDNSTEGKDWSACLHFTYIQNGQSQAYPPPFPVPPPVQNNNPLQSPFDSIAGDIRIIRDMIECQLLRESNNKDSKKGYIQWLGYAT